MDILYLYKALPIYIRSRIKGREKLHRIVTNMGWLVMDKLVRMGVGLFVGVWLARYLGSQQFGTLNYALAFIWLLTPLATLGLDSVVVRNLVHATEPDKINELMGTTFVLKLAGGILSVIISIAAVCALRSDTITRLMVSIIAIGTIFQSFDVVDIWFQSQIRSKFTVYARNAAFLVISVIKIVLLKLHAPLIAFAWTAAGELALGAVGLYVCYSIAHQSVRVWRFSIRCATLLLTDSWFLMLTGILIYIYMRIDQIMLGQMTSDKEVGIYSAAVKLAEIWYFIPGAVISSVFPAVVAAKKDGAESYHRRLLLLHSCMAALAYAVVLPTAFFSHRLIVLVYGKGFSDAGMSLMVLSFAFLFVCLGLATQSWMISEGLMKLPLLTTALGALTNIALNFILIPSHGATGAAIATLIAQFVSVTLAALLIRQSRPAFIMQMKSLYLDGLVPYSKIRLFLQGWYARLSNTDG